MEKKKGPVILDEESLARTLVRHPVIYVSDLVDPRLISALHMDLAATADEALAKAFAIKGPDARVAVVPNGPGVVIVD